MHRLLLTTLALFTGAVCFCTCAKQDQEAPLLVDGEIKVSALNSKDNPFRNEYTSADKWIFENIRLTGSSDFAQDTDHRSTFGAMIDSKGCLLPQKEQLRIALAARSKGLDPDYSSYKWVEAVGVCPSEIAEALISEKYELYADYFPAVPAWLISKLEQKPTAQRIMLPPNGDVLILVSASATANPCNPCSLGGQTGQSGSPLALHWERYDKEGNWIFSTDGRTWWEAYYFPRYHDGDRSAMRPDGSYYGRPDGFAVFTKDGRSTYYDYDARLLGNLSPPLRSRLPFSELQIGFVRRLYQAQTGVN